MQNDDMATKTNQSELSNFVGYFVVFIIDLNTYKHYSKVTYFPIFLYFAFSYVIN